MGLKYPSVVRSGTAINIYDSVSALRLVIGLVYFLQALALSFSAHFMRTVHSLNCSCLRYWD